VSLKSMTGFGQGFAHVSGLRADVEISSVNRKQLDVLVNLPRALATLEPWVVEKISHAVSRGRVQVQVALQATGEVAATKVQVDDRLAMASLKEMRRVAKKLGIKDDVGLSDLLRIHGVLVLREAGEDVEKVKPAIEKALDRAMRAFALMRKREGEALARDFSKRIETMTVLADRIGRRAPALTAHYRTMLRERIRMLAGDIAIGDERIEKEVVMFADRADISEELTRLRSHLQQARGMMRQKEPAGRSLDFLAQEMFREINTIGSKAADATISSVVVQFKAELERLREQAQNIE
jgi:uncharacterized protein (TIGR00255 family)